MKGKFYAVLMLVMILTLSACGGGDSSPSTISTQIVSDPTIDGYIVNAVTITQGMSFPTVQSVFAGIDPVNQNEFRAFLDFPLTGTGGVPGNAVIVSATLDIFINSIQPLTGAIPIRIDLVDFQPPLILDDFDRAILLPLAFITTQIFQSDNNKHVVLDVTSLMKEAQLRGLPDFQIRILEDFGIVAPGLIEIDDSTATPADRASFAPLLEVTYF